MDTKTEFLYHLQTYMPFSILELIEEKIMENKFFLLISGLFLTILTHAECQRPDRAHENKEVAHCPYLKENIYKAYAEKPGTYGNLEKYKKCFFCECPIEEHTTEVKKVVKKKK